ncbi:MAG TPA: hypothetical protein VLM76_15665, partial [Patescibacteria group bacterium]|nr:hypothetical protein [Patescibacteria group bacterium]
MAGRGAGRPSAWLRDPQQLRATVASDGGPAIWTDWLLGTEALPPGGAWAVSTAQVQTVAIPVAAVAGDLAILFSAWRPFDVSATVDQGWTEIVDGSEGSTADGAGVGSSRLFVAWKVLGAAETNPTLTRSGPVSIAGAVIVTLSKPADRVWSIAALSAIAEALIGPGTGVTLWVHTSSAIAADDQVWALSAVADHQATFTRQPTAIHSGPTWSGDAVENPADHLATTAGNRMVADIVHRLASGAFDPGWIGVTVPLDAEERVTTVLVRVRTTADARSGSTTLTHVHVTSATGSKGGRGAATLTHAHAATATGRKGASGAATPVAHASATTATGRKGGRGAATLAHASTTTATGRKGGRGAATLAHASATTAAGRKGASGAATLAHVSTTTAAGRKGVSGVAALTHVSVTTATGRKEARGTATVAHASVTTAAGRKGASSTATLVHASVVTAAGRKEARGSATLTHVHATAATGSGQQADHRSGTATLTHVHATAATGRKGGRGAATLVHASVTSATGRKGTSGTATVTH